ncbi:MAG: 2-oxo-4-hydroxy-4-carboxy-5-ureidoimidazoline decarboxylase [Oculatellaceae cyanobacterium Prado106]|jgi:2-oxo-4-hydroxy-4-carboxy-5-ureidoimidazoline decarboxylase|nr:2-oxo-4-hydroxy-4-carboxy-5-ureidoimidazoline decarboxylase [Oculatellaceae cyanobacterium Prado106]
MKLSEVNQMTQDAFVDAFGAVFEESPAIAQQAWNQRPFANLDALHQSMVELVRGMSVEQQLALIRAHPDLGSRVKMAEASVQEQAGAGLDGLSGAEYERFQALNQAYRERFGFPFIVAVRNHTKQSILECFVRRLENEAAVERGGAIAEIEKIARFRLMDWVGEG